MNTIKTLMLTAALSMGLAAGAQTTAESGFVRTDGVHFYKGKSQTPYYYVGANFWQGPLLGSTSEAGNRKKLCAELDSLKAIGVDNLRILAGADAGSKNVTSVTPYLQTEPGKYDERMFEGLDYLLAEMGKRGMVAVIYLTNSWDWSGGYGFYLRSTGHGDSPDAHGEGYKAYVKYATEFNNDLKAQQLYYNHVRRVVSRVNSITGKPYRDDPTIMAWQLCNEPRIFGSRTFDGYKEGFIKWSRTSTALIKSLDPNHLVSTGSEGLIGCDFDATLYEQQHADPNVDYLTVHIWPVNWRWARPENLTGDLPNTFQKAADCIEQHEAYGRKLNKPVVIEEFGYSRDNTAYDPGTPVSARNAFYAYVFSRVRESQAEQGPIAGCNFWGWGGSGRPSEVTWKPGDDYVSDPPHEPQGWYCVFDSDTTTIQLIKGALKSSTPARPPKP